MREDLAQPCGSTQDNRIRLNSKALRQVRTGGADQAIERSLRPATERVVELPRSASARAINIWCFDLEIGPTEATRFIASLATDEQERAMRFVRAEHQRRFIAGRFYMREILGHLCGNTGSQLRFQYGLGGKPELVGVSNLHFNLAHSGRFGVLATCAAARVGIDVEVMGSYHDVACRVLTPKELVFFGRHRGDHAELFSRYWSGKEAFLKLWGIGLSVDPRAIEIDWVDPPICRPLMSHHPGIDVAFLRPVSIASEAICTVACEWPPAAVLRRWPPIRPGARAPLVESVGSAGGRDR